MSLEDSLDDSGKENIEDFIQNLVESVQMKILKPDINRKQESKMLFKSVSTVLIGLESLLSKVCLAITTKNAFINRNLNCSVSIISGIVNATSLLENLAPLSKVVTLKMESFKKALLDEGVDLWIDQKIQCEVADAIRMAMEKAKRVSPIIITNSRTKGLSSPKAFSPGKFLYKLNIETPLIKDILSSVTAVEELPDETWLIDKDLKHMQQITKQTILDTIGTVSNVYKTCQTTKFGALNQVNEEISFEDLDSSALDAELARMKSITDMNVARSITIANAIHDGKRSNKS